MKERQEKYTQRVNRACLTGVASKWQGAPPRSGGRHEWRRLFGGGVGDLGGRCRAHTGGRGMWDVEGGRQWGSGVEYLPG